ncbi:MAG: PriCT-2 domain-containing protein [Prevotellaceae bacterium]|jgi:hypothetical protein|nr:PriCT-2 domain-containing protein [Prevotellaceae bacterium]
MFNPQKWKPAQDTYTPRTPRDCREGNSNFDKIIAEIERRGIDIAPTYTQWVRLGFAFASEFGESGRDYFHRCSRFYHKYSTAETNRQYTHCLRGKHGITILTFYYLAKNNGIKL